MLSVHSAAKVLGVSESRVRALLKEGKLEGEKLGRAWMVREDSVASRLQSNPGPGRPHCDVSLPERSVPDIETAHRIYDEAARVLSGCYDSRLLDCARTPEEQAFWIRVADFFLQQRQQELIAEGVF
ncbi:MAG: helix-turn-helix domain-containing protein [Coriobacteriales bacterium]|jgi:excisionase family DNA binding protein